MSAEQDAGKSGKKLAALLGLGSIILFGAISRFPNYQGVTAICSQP